MNPNHDWERCILLFQWYVNIENFKVALNPNLSLPLTLIKEASGHVRTELKRNLEPILNNLLQFFQEYRHPIVSNRLYVESRHLYQDLENSLELPALSIVYFRSADEHKGYQDTIQFLVMIVLLKSWRTGRYNIVCEPSTGAIKVWTTMIPKFGSIYPFTVPWLNSSCVGVPSSGMPCPRTETRTVTCPSKATLEKKPVIRSQMLF